MSISLFGIWEGGDTDDDKTMQKKTNFIKRQESGAIQWAIWLQFYA